jgi:hypothetical protein
MTQDLLDLLQEGAELVRHSQFSLAVEKAQEKLKKFQLPDPRYYIAQILQALLASGAQHIGVHISGNSVRVTFDGLGYSQNELKNLTDAVFESGKNRDRDRIREMALGLLSVQALKPKEVTLCSGGFRWNKNLKVLESCAADLQEFCVVHRRGDADEEKILRQVAQSCRAKIRINGHVVCNLEGALVTSCPWPNFSFRGNGFSGAFGISYGNTECTTLALTRYGVVFSRRQESRIQPPLVVEMEHSALRKNASQSDVVEDESYTQMLADLQKVQLEFALKLASQRLPPYQAGNVFDYLREIVLQNITPEMLELPEAALDELETRLLKAPLLAGANGRRYSLRDLQLFQPVFYLNQMVRSGNLPEITLLLPDKDVARMNNLFPIHPLQSGEHQRQRNLLEQQSSQAKPQALVMSRLGSGSKSFELALLKAPAPNAEIFHYRCQGLRVEATQSLGRGKLHWAIFSQSNFDQKQLGTLQPAIEALYEQIPSRLQAEGRRGFKMPLQQRLAEYLMFKHGSLALALAETKWRELRIFSTCLGAGVSILDLQAWLEVYPQVIASHSPLATCQEDHALLLSPEWLAALQQMFSKEKVWLASLSQPHILERTQQGGLSQAALKGVERVKQQDEDEELAAIRREIEGAQQGALQVDEEQPLDAEAVLNFLRIEQPQPSAPEVPEFARQCLAATASLNTRWLSRFQLPGLQGQVLMHSGSLPSPLQAEHLLVNVADNDPVAYPLAFLGMSGWLQIPPNWPVPESLEEIQRVTPDSRSNLGGEISQENIDWPFDLGQPSLHLDLLWATRRLYKFGAQHLGMASPMDPQAALWKRPLSLYLLWDDGWALSCRESWFGRLPLWSNWRGHWRSLNHWRNQPGDLFCAPLSGGSVALPEQTIRLLPPFSREKLEAWLARPLSAPELISGQQEQDQLLTQLKEHLVQSCQLAGCPLEPSWLDGLHFGEPSRWILGPRKYFIAHQPAQASTRLNPASPTLRKLVAEPQNWPSQTPVLASAIYTAINRALDEVEDAHELAYLQAMLSQLA